MWTLTKWKMIMSVKINAMSPVDLENKILKYSGIWDANWISNQSKTTVIIVNKENIKWKITDKRKISGYNRLNYGTVIQTVSQPITESFSRIGYSYVKWKFPDDDNARFFISTEQSVWTTTILWLIIILSTKRFIFKQVLIKTVKIYLVSKNLRNWYKEKQSSNLL